MNKVLAMGVAALLGFISLASNSARSSATAQQARQIAALQLEEEIPVPNVAGRLDHFTADAKRKRLFVSALGNNTLEVIDVFSGKVIHSIQGLSEPQGPLYVPDFDKLYVANAGDGKVNVYDGATYTLRKAIEIRRPERRAGPRSRPNSSDLCVMVRILLLVDVNEADIKSSSAGYINAPQLRVKINAIHPVHRGEIGGLLARRRIRRDHLRRYVSTEEQALRRLIESCIAGALAADGPSGKYLAFLRINHLDLAGRRDQNKQRVS